MGSQLRNRSLFILAATLLLLIAAPGVASSKKAGSPGPIARTVAGVEFLGEVVVPSGSLFGGSEIGGLSSITYDAARRAYHAISDDQGNRPTGDPVRYYTLEIDLSDGAFDAGDLEFTDVTQIYDDGKHPFAPGGLDPEGLVMRGGQFFVSSEGNPLADPIIDPFIRRYNRDGRQTAALPIPDKFLPNGVDHGVRFNLSFESMNLTPNRRYLVSAGEDALFQDGPASSFESGSFTRIVVFDVRKRAALAEYVYEVAPWAEPSAIFGVNGIVEVLPIDDAGTMLVMERSFSVGGVLGGGTGNYVVINQVSTTGASDVSSVDALYEGGTPVDFTPVTQHVVFSFDDLGIPIDNIEGMTFGPRLPDGRHTLVIVSDNNFSAAQFTQFIVLALDIEPAS